MAVKKETAAVTAAELAARQEPEKAHAQEPEKAPAQEPEKEKEVRIHLFKDSHRYSAPVFVGVNGENYLIQRGVDVDVPEAVAEVLHNSQVMESAAMEKIAAAEAQANKAAAVQKL